MGRLSKVEIHRRYSGASSGPGPGRGRALFLRVREGDKSARETLIKGNLRLLIGASKKFIGTSWIPEVPFGLG